MKEERGKQDVLVFLTGFKTTFRADQARPKIKPLIGNKPGSGPMIVIQACLFRVWLGLFPPLIVGVCVSVKKRERRGEREERKREEKEKSLK